MAYVASCSAGVEVEIVDHDSRDEFVCCDCGASLEDDPHAAFCDNCGRPMCDACYDPQGGRCDQCCEREWPLKAVIL
jgi:hypothetical protein